jgi:hypothetical protein
LTEIPSGKFACGIMSTAFLQRKLVQNMGKTWNIFEKNDKSD